MFFFGLVKIYLSRKISSRLDCCRGSCYHLTMFTSKTTTRAVKPLDRDLEGKDALYLTIASVKAPCYGMNFITGSKFGENSNICMIFTFSFIGMSTCVSTKWGRMYVSKGVQIWNLAVFEGQTFHSCSVCVCVCVCSRCCKLNRGSSSVIDCGYPIEIYVI